MMTQAQPVKFGAAPYLAASNSAPVSSSKRRLTRTDMVLHVGNTRISFTETVENSSTRKPADKPSDPNALAQFIHSRFTTITSEFGEDYAEARGCRVNFSDENTPDTGTLTAACFLLSGLGYVATPEGDAPHKSVWVKHSDY